MCCNYGFKDILSSWSNRTRALRRIHRFRLCLYSGSQYSSPGIKTVIEGQNMGNLQTDANAVGEDEFGYMLAGILKQNKVKNSGMRFDPAARIALAFVTLRSDGERDFMFFRNPSADMLLRESELDINLIKQVTVGLPDVRGRVEDILKVHSSNKKLDKDVSLGVIAMRTPGFSGADLANLMNETAILAGQRGKDKITLKEIDDSIDRIIAGMEGTKMTDRKSKILVACHEIGHAVCA